MAGAVMYKKSFSLGVAKDEPQNAGATAEIEGITFFIEESDIWYFDNHDLHIDYNESVKEPEFHYE
ncbi:hypothetical protein BsIDN1_33550 [Bacillus safensis]|uniref:FeS cluster biogenesis domain-containing protein n=1 Tax=Bacillus safensis TaxID=561879 RepID=A0A5S9M8B4_BACIA|nr:hypothetical protein BsIDN1_33550 [Bacillus safensis]